MSLRKDLRREPRRGQKIALKNPRISEKTPLKKRSKVLAHSGKVAEQKKLISENQSETINSNEGKNQETLSQPVKTEVSLQNELAINEKDLVTLKMFGLSINPDLPRPLLILRDENKKYTLQVPLNLLETGIAAAQEVSGLPPATPHRFTLMMLDSLGIKMNRCVFVEARGRDLFVRLFMSGHPKLESLRVRADHAMSLCQFLNIPILASPEFIRLANQNLAAAELSEKSLGEQHPLLRHAPKGMTLQ